MTRKLFVAFGNELAEAIPESNGVVMARLYRSTK